MSPSRFLTSHFLLRPFPPTSLPAAAAMSSSSNFPAEPADHEPNNITKVLTYHNQTKHAMHKYARGPHGLDWANQPNPFRRYSAAPLLPLPLPPPSSSSPLYHSIFTSLPSPPQPITKSTISQLFYNSMALSAWKTIGSSTWSLRVNPSSGNLHPTESYLISPPIDSLSDSPFVAHYAPKEHGLEIRAMIDPRLPSFPMKDSFMVGISSIFWREAWKYGERAFRYCNHDVGHAIAAISMAAAELGWDVKLLDGLGFNELQRLMGLHHGFSIPEIEIEHPDCVLLVFPADQIQNHSSLNFNYEELCSAAMKFEELDWKGKPNLLSKEHVCWDIIYKTADAVKKPSSLRDGFRIEQFQGSGVHSESSYRGLTVGEVVRKRRSAVDMDGVTKIDRDAFYQIMLHCLPSKQQSALPFRSLSWDAEVHAALFVHRVEGLPKGLYFLVRNEEHLDQIRKGTRSEFKWEKPEGCPESLPLYELARGDCQRVAKALSCHQDIAGDGCFSLGMVARFEPALSSKGAWMYPRLFWETGVLGQVLYLEAHAIGISATGIGCFFDDPVHELLGLRGSEFQSLYHFTVGGPVLDKRIMSLPAYPGPAMDA